MKTQGRERQIGESRAGERSEGQAGRKRRVATDGRICTHCAYACRVRPELSEPRRASPRQLLICLNHPGAPGEFQAVRDHSTCPNFRFRREQTQLSALPEPPNADVKYIPLTQGKYAIVDAADFDWLSQYKWFATRNRSGTTFYAGRGEAGRTVLMHREILSVAPGELVDHANHLGWDNRRSNIRPCTAQQNIFNRQMGPHSSRYQGVFYRKDCRKWATRICLDQQTEYFGLFADEAEAARVWDRWAFALRGRFAYLNFPEAFEGKDPADPEFQVLRDQFAERRRKREEKRRKEKVKR